MAWRADDLAYGRWIERTHFPDIPWTLSVEGRREARRRRQLALAKGEPAGSLIERSREVMADAVRWCFPVMPPGVCCWAGSGPAGYA